MPSEGFFDSALACETLEKIWGTFAGSCRTTQGEHQAQAAVQRFGDRDPGAAV